MSKHRSCFCWRNPRANRDRPIRECNIVCLVRRQPWLCPLHVWLCFGFVPLLLHCKCCTKCIFSSELLSVCWAWTNKVHNKLYHKNGCGAQEVKGSFHHNEFCSIRTQKFMQTIYKCVFTHLCRPPGSACLVLNLVWDIFETCCCLFLQVRQCFWTLGRDLWICWAAHQQVCQVGKVSAAVPFVSLSCPYSPFVSSTEGAFYTINSLMKNGIIQLHHSSKPRGKSAGGKAHWMSPSHIQKMKKDYFKH